MAASAPGGGPDGWPGRPATLRFPQLREGMFPPPPLERERESERKRKGVKDGVREKC